MHKAFTPKGIRNLYTSSQPFFVLSSTLYVEFRLYSAPLCTIIM